MDQSERANSVENMEVECDGDKVTTGGIDESQSIINGAGGQKQPDENEELKTMEEPTKMDYQQQAYVQNDINARPHCNFDELNFAENQCCEPHAQSIEMQDEHSEMEHSKKHSEIQCNEEEHLVHSEERLRMQGIEEQPHIVEHLGAHQGTHDLEMQDTQEHFKTQGTQEHLETQGTQGHLETQGTQGHLETQGTQEHLETQGTQEHLEMQGTQGHLETQGTQGHLETQGTQGHLETQGTQEHLKMQDTEEHLKMQGNQEHLETQGTQGHLEMQDAQEHLKMQGTQEHLETQGTQEHLKMQGTQEHLETQGTQGHLEMQGTQEHFKMQGTQEHLETQGTQGHLEMQDAQEHLEMQGIQEHLKMQDTQEHLKMQGTQEHLETQGTQGHLETQGTQEHFKMQATQEHLETQGTQEHLETQGTQGHLEMQDTQEHLKMQGTQEHLETQGTQGHLETQGTQGHLEMQDAQEHLKTQGNQEHLEMQGTQEHLRTQEHLEMQASAIQRIERSQSTERQFEANLQGSECLQLCGLQNLGNQCYMNATLQCLSHTHILRDYLWKPLQLPSHSSRHHGLGDQIVAAYRNLQQIMEQYPHVSPLELKQTVGHFAPRFAGHAQEDAQEFLTFLLDGLHEGMNRVKVKKYVSMTIENGESWTDKEMADELWRRHLIRNNSEIVELFHGQIKSVLKCLTCTKATKTFEPVMQLTLPVPTTMSDQNCYCKSSYKLSLYDCIKLYTKEKPLQWFCEHCFKQTANIQKYDIWKLPPVLIIHLKRFSVTFRGGHTKVNSEVTFPERLDLSKYSDSDRTDSVYQLYAVIDHVGMLYAGHYTALVREGDNWYLCNDHVCYRINPDDVFERKSSAYVLFYMKAAGRSRRPSV